MGIKTSLFSPNRKNDCAADSDNTFSSLNGRARQQLYEVEPDLVPYYDAIYKMVNSQEDCLCLDPPRIWTMACTLGA